MSTNPAAGSTDAAPGALMEMLRIAAPSVATMASYMGMQFCDRLMVKEIGPDPVYLAAHGNAAIATWTLMTFIVGMAGIISSFVSQNLGAGRPERGAAYAWNMMWLGLGYYLVVLLPGALMAPLVLRMLGHTEQLYELELQYAVIAMVGGVFTIWAKGFHNYFFGMHRAGVVLASAVCGNLVNVVLNVVLIFGESGPPPSWPLAELFVWISSVLHVPAMGLAGAALATVAGTAVEFAIPFVLFVGPGMARRFGTRRSWKPNAACIRDILRVGWPAGFMMLNELLCWAYLMTFLTGHGAARAAEAAGGTAEAAARAATMANTAGFAALQWMHLSFMPALGLSIATQAVVGKAVGAGDLKGAATRTWLGLRVAVAYMGVCGVAFYFFREELIGLFINASTPAADAELILHLGIQILLAAAVFQVFDATAITMSAALRGAGDTLWPGVVTIGAGWICLVGLGHVLVALRPEWGALGPWIGAGAYFFLLALTLVGRFLGGRWRTIRLTHDDVLHNLPPDGVAPGPGV
ncbi:MAG: MATE family efflux transporter [Planctomycetota bacterium]|nr:MAG: MATE family efflux transporter [Planctomycetota bacterium]